MADTDVKKKVTFHAEEGMAWGWVVEYEAGREGGDHYCAGFSTQAMKDAGFGDVWSGWKQVGAGRNQVTIH